MKVLFILLVCILSGTVFSQEDQPKHLISIGTDGFGWSGTGMVFDLDKDKTTRDEQNSSFGSFNLNYNYIFPARLMLGAEFDVEYSKTEIEYENGDDIEEESRSTTLALALGYNFNQDIYNSFWIKGLLGGGTIETSSEDSGAPDNDEDTDSTLGFVTLEFGKRFNFNISGLKNISYAPSLALSRVTFGEDAEDAGFDSATLLQLNIIKFDVLF